MVVKGFDQFQKKIDEIKDKLDSVEGTHSVSFPELFNEQFMQKYTTHHSIDAMFTASGFEIDSKEDFEKIPDDAWEKFVTSTTSFSSWLDTLGRLTVLYSDIDYSTDYERGKFHASLSAAYLKNAVQTAVQNDLTDVAMSGMKWLGNVAILLAQKAQPESSVQLTKDIMLISAMAFAKKENRPITMAGVQQLAALTFSLLKLKDHDIKYALKEVKNSVSTLAQVLLTIPDNTMGEIHGSNLGAYYSSTSFQSLSSVLTQYANALIAAPENDEDAAKLIVNFSHWTDDMYQVEKEVLLAAVRVRSHFTFDIIYWIEHISKLSLALSACQACPSHYKDELENSAVWLISLYSWIPDDAESVGFVENYQLVEKIFDVAFEAGRRECWHFLDSAFDLLLNWAIRTGKYQTGWGGFEKAIYGIASLIAVFGNVPSKKAPMEDRLFTKLQAVSSYDQERRSRLARNISQRALNSNHQESRYSKIDAALSQQRSDIVRPILERVAAILSTAHSAPPATANTNAPLQK